MRLRPASLALALLAGLVVVPLPAAGDPLTPVLGAAGFCDDLDPRACLLPFPSDTFTALDDSTPTGRRVDLDLLEMPRNVAGKPIDPTEWNHNDGFSPGTPMLTFVPGLDLARTFGLDPTPETGVGTSGDPWAVRDGVPDALIEDPARSMARKAPIVLLDADTGERHPYWAELDENAATLEEGADRTLIIRPLENLAEGHRYIVALRDLRDTGRQHHPCGARLRRAPRLLPPSPRQPVPGTRRHRPGRPGGALRRHLHPAGRPRRRRARPLPRLGLPRRLRRQPGRTGPGDPRRRVHPARRHRPRRRQRAGQVTGLHRHRGRRRGRPAHRARLGHRAQLPDHPAGRGAGCRGRGVRARRTPVALLLRRRA